MKVECGQHVDGRHLAADVAGPSLEHGLKVSPPDPVGDASYLVSLHVSSTRPPATTTLKVEVPRLVIWGMKLPGLLEALDQLAAARADAGP
jgi:hypothetical protein